MYAIRSCKPRLLPTVTARAQTQQISLGPQVKSVRRAHEGGAIERIPTELPHLSRLAKVHTPESSSRNDQDRVIFGKPCGRTSVEDHQRLEAPVHALPS